MRTESVHAVGRDQSAPYSRRVASAPKNGWASISRTRACMIRAEAARSASALRSAGQSRAAQAATMPLPGIPMPLPGIKMVTLRLLLLRGG